MTATLPTVGRSPGLAHGDRAHLFGWLLPPDHAGLVRRWLVRGLLLVLAISGLATLRIQISALSAPWVYVKDFTQEYLLARAVVEGVNPYLPAPVLAERYVPAALSEVPWHPVPHPPFLALLVSPLGLVSYEIASAIWLGLQLLLLLAVVCLIASTSHSQWSRLHVLTAFCILLLWLPVQHDLFFGQLTLLVAAPLFASWVAYRAGRPALAGVLLGAAIAIKLFPIAVAGYFLLKRQWRVLAWAAATFIGTSSLAALVIGSEAVMAFVVEGLPGAASHRAAVGNHSVTGAVWHVFAGSGSIPPIIDLPSIAEPLSVLASLGILAVTARAIVRAADPDVEFALVLCAMVLASPLAWQFYFVLLIWPLWEIGRRLYSTGWPRGHTNLFLLALLMLTVPAIQIVNLARMLHALLGDNVSSASLLALSGLPLIGLVVGPGLLFVLLLRELGGDRRSANPDTLPHPGSLPRATTAIVLQRLRHILFTRHS